jgi:predicted nucleic acid-binding protein
MDHPVTAIYDANVLYSAPLRDLLIRLAQAGLVRGRWTDAIHDEWMRNVLANRSELSAERLARTRSLMDQAVRDCLVTGYESRIASLTLPDPDDRHVLAAAIQAKARVILTFNLRDFPDAALSPHGVQAVHPDAFLCSLLDVAPAVVCGIIQRQRSALRHPPKSVADLLSLFEGLTLSASVVRLRKMADSL